MSINKLKVFAESEDAQKSTVGLELEKGFPKALKPARAWFNYLFNSLTSKTNEIIEGLNEVMAKEHYGIGDIYLTTASHTPESVAEKVGYGTWQLYAEGKAIVGLSQSPTDPEWTKEVETVFGEYEHQLTIGEMPKHTHNVTQIKNNVDLSIGGRDSSTQRELGPSAPEGSDQPHNNVQPSIIIAIWKRVS